MGFLDGLKKTAINKIVDSTGKNLGNAIGKTIISKIENAAGASIKSTGKPDNSHENSPRSFAADQKTSPAQSGSPVNSLNVEQKFDQIFAAEFSDLAVVRNASPESIGIQAPQPCRPYTYALQRGGKTVAAIMLTPHNRDKNSAFLNARKSALDSRIAFLNFYTHFENERGYVVSRIKNVL